MLFYLKEWLKKMVPLTIHIFNLEMRAQHIEREEEQKELIEVFERGEETAYRKLEGLQEQLCAQRAQFQKMQEQLSAQNFQLQQELELKLNTLKKEWDDEHKGQTEIIQHLLEKLSEKLQNLEGRQDRGKDQIISAVWDSRNSALWEAKEEMIVYNRQWQQIFWYWLAVRGELSLLQVKETFFKALPKAEGSVRQLQRMELYLLQQLKRICEKNGLRYWMTDGSLLGTVRHEGFVPWDDDLDVGMPRADFERLREVLRDNKHFQVVDYYCLVEPRWYSKISKFVDLDSGSSVFIDLFPYDYYDVETRQEALAQYRDRRVELVSELDKLIPNLKYRYRDVRVDNSEDKAALDTVFAKCVADYPKSGKWMGWSVEIWESEARIGFPEGVIYPCSQGTFEEIVVSIPADAKAWLKQVYGEYMEFPRDVGMQNHIEMFGLDQQEEQIRNFLRQRDFEEERPQGLGTEEKDGSGRGTETPL